MTDYITWGEFVVAVENAGVSNDTPIETIDAKTTFRDDLRFDVDLHTQNGKVTGADIWLRVKP
ncbi:MAG TPA: hypothetical protein VMY37_18200 [Thermoguttaceae bacterium]|nr:hypothetical protein [Thermoguttaceae bacterium]